MRAVLAAVPCLLLLPAALVAVAAPPPAAAQDVPVPEDPTDPEDWLDTLLAVLDLLVPDHLPNPTTPTDAANPACDPIDPALCLFPFPSDRWTVSDASTATGRRVELPAVGMPRNVYGKPVDPTEWNRNDGFSPGAMLLTMVPGLDLVRTWGLQDHPERYQDQVTDLARSLAADAPIVLVDATTGERHPFSSELDAHPDTPPDERTLIIRPAVNLLEGHRYVVGLRNLVDANGSPIAAGAAFATLRDGDGGDRQAHYDEAVFPVLAAAGVARDELFLAWDFTVASGRNLAGRVLAMRDAAFADLGDTDLADLEVAGDAPSFSVEAAVDDDDPEADTFRVVTGTVTVPNYLVVPQTEVLTIPEVGTFDVPLSRLFYGEPLPGPDATPQVNPVAPTREVAFECHVPRTALDGPPARPALYGHGLLGGKRESGGSSTERMREDGYMPCAVDWLGMSTGDLPNVALILQDVSWFPSLADRAQQGFLHFLYLGRALAHPAGLVSDPAFQRPDGQPLFDPGTLVYDGNSQGGIMGGALTALAVDHTRAVLGVPGMNYSTLLNRSVDWEGAYGEVLYATYPNKVEQQLLFALIQMLWDRGEANGYAQHMTDDPYPNTPPHQVLLHVAYGDHQVSNLAAEVEGRTIGALRIAGDVPTCRHWALDPLFGFDTIDGAVDGRSALVYWDSGTPTSPTDNTAPAGPAFGDDPHSDPRKDPVAQQQKDVFLRTGRIVDVHPGHYRTDRWPERAGDRLDAVLAEVAACAAAAPAAPTAGDAPADDEGSAPLPTTGGGAAAAALAAISAAVAAGRGGLRRGAPRGPAPRR